MLFARNVKFQVKDGKLDEFNRTFLSSVLPLLKSQPGFKSELTLLDDDHAMGISVWQDRASADKYESTTFKQILDTLQPLLTAPPVVQRYDVGLLAA